MALAAAMLLAAPGLASQADYDASIAAAKSVMMQDPARALALGRRAETQAAGLSARQAELDAARAQWLQGEALARLDQLELGWPCQA